VTQDPFETGAARPPQGPPEGFGDSAGEMANETEVEEALRRQGASASAGSDEESSHAEEAAEPAAEPDAPTGDQSVDDEVAVARIEAAERLADLQRLQAEFVNYKRRVERDRELIRENATYAALAPIVEVLDTVDRAREHGDLDPGFQAVADQLERTVERLGLAKFGAAGDPFDPTIHEALSHIGEDPDVEVTTCKVVAKAGYRMGDRVVRAAQVLVVDPGERDEPPAQEM
jgi:molecular chaperone GrpE